MPTTNKAIFYCGTNGAGKSTLRAFKNDVVQIIIDSDHIAMEMNPDNPRLVDASAGRKAIELFKFAIEHNISFSMESTLSGKSILQRMKIAKQNGFFTRLNYVGLSDVQINLSRVKQRVRAGGHGIDENIIKQRFVTSRENLVQAILLADETVIYDNSGQRPKIILKITERYITTSANLPLWGNILLQELISNGFTLKQEE